MSLTGFLVEFAVAVIDRLGYAGIFFLMMLESMVAPVPSEGVMPFAGFLVATGRFASVWTVTIVATLGSIAGSWISYEAGKHLGRPLVVRWGKWLFLSERDLDWADRFFRRRGPMAVFVARYIPVVRHLISLPAGMARMPLGPFLLVTTLGAFGWNLILTYVGYVLGENWEQVKTTLEPFDYAIAGILVVGFAWFVVAHWRRARSQRPAAATKDDPAA